MILRVSPTFQLVSPSKLPVLSEKLLIKLVSNADDSSTDNDKLSAGFACFRCFLSGVINTSSTLAGFKTGSNLFFKLVLSIRKDLSCFSSGVITVFCFSFSRLASLLAEVFSISVDFS